jgi:hypothetical protein
LSAVGRREKEAAFAKSLVRNFVELGRPCRLAKADAAAKRESFKLPEPDKSDVVAELGRQEIRSYVRSLPRDEQMQATLAGCDAPNDLGAVGDHFLGMERPLVAGEALNQDPACFIDKNAHRL